MTLSVPMWAVPLVLTILTWVSLAGVMRWRDNAGKYSGDYNFSGAFEGLAFFALAVIITLLIWCGFFAIGWATA